MVTHAMFCKIQHVSAHTPIHISCISGIDIISHYRQKGGKLQGILLFLYIARYIARFLMGIKYTISVVYIANKNTYHVLTA